MYRIILILLFTISINISAQYTISGYVKDSLSGEALMYATIFDSITKIPVIANNYGYFSLKTSKSECNLYVSYIGYHRAIVKLKVNRDTLIEIRLSNANIIKEVEIKGELNNNTSNTASEINIPVSRIYTIPSFMGEHDILKSIQLYPGIQAGAEGTGSIHVRGGTPDQNLILLDGVPLYDVNHLMGFFSIFNSNSIQNLKFIKGGIPASYGGKLSSVMDISMKEGNNQKLGGNFNIGILSSDFLFEGPVIKNKCSFLISVRRTYYDLFVTPIFRIIQGDAWAGYYFYDINGKINYSLSEKDRLFLSFYKGIDKFYINLSENIGEKDKRKLFWGNDLVSLRWNHSFGSGLFMNTTIAYTQYKFNTSSELTSKWNDNENISATYFTNITDYIYKTHFDYALNKNNQLKAGIGATFHTFKPGIYDVYSKVDHIDTTFYGKIINNTEVYVFAEDIININQKNSVDIGIHYRLLPGYGKEYRSFEPRIGISHSLIQNLTLKYSFTYISQYVNLLGTSTVGLPTDRWVPSTEKIKPQHAYQYCVSFIYENKKYKLSIDPYYKLMSNLVEYREGASYLLLKDNWEKNIIQGKGKAYGIEFMAEKKEGEFTGWISYTLSKNTRQFADINNGNEFPYKYDRRHNINIVANYKIKENLRLDMVWIYNSGARYTLTNSQYIALSCFDDLGRYNGRNLEEDFYTINNYTEKNSYKLPDYHRLDIGITKIKQKKHGVASKSFGLYNAYNRMNVFTAIMREKDDGTTVLKKITFFPLMPYFTYGFKF
jgi:outer membrane receptor for ferrienterochelin and colicin